jgi:hypothetical protein
MAADRGWPLIGVITSLSCRAQPVEVEVLLDKQVRMIACGAHHVGCTVVHGWVPDEEAKDCMACNKNFTTIRRRVRQFLV